MGGGKFFPVVIGVLLSSFLCGCEAVNQSAGPALPPRGDTAFARACDYDEQSEIFLAQAEYARAIALDPMDTRAYVNLGQTYARMGLKDTAAAVWYAAIHVNPKDTRAWNLLGTHYTVRKQHAKALACYKRAVEADPGHADAHWNAAMASRHLGIENRAGVHYTRFLELAAGLKTDATIEAKQYLATLKDDSFRMSAPTVAETTMLAEDAPVEPKSADAEQAQTGDEPDDVFAETCEPDFDTYSEELPDDVVEETDEQVNAEK